MWQKKSLREGRTGLLSVMDSYLAGHCRGNDRIVKSFELDDIKQSFRAFVLGTGDAEMKWHGPVIK